MYYVNPKEMNGLCISILGVRLAAEVPQADIGINLPMDHPILTQYS
jgi:hypothetical protein